jgi:hypothetical protein
MTRTKHGFASFIGIKAEENIDQFHLTAAEVTALHSAPITLIKAPGGNKVIVVNRAIVQYRYGTVQYTGGGAVQLVYHGATTNLLTGTVAAATIQAAANATISLGAGASGLALTTNTAVDLYAATADFAAGDGVARVTVWYTVYQLSQQ